MTFDDVRRGLEKVEKATPTLRAFKRASMLGVHLPTGDTLDTYLPTFLYISVVSLLDDALEEFISVNYPTSKARKLNDRIEFLHKKGKVKDVARLRRIRDARHKYAHEAGQFAAWKDVQWLFGAVRDELGHLGAL